MAIIEARPGEWTYRAFATHSGMGKDAREKAVHGSALPTACYFLNHQLLAIGLWEEIIKTPDPNKYLHRNEIVTLTHFNPGYNAISEYIGDCMLGTIPGLPRCNTYNILFQTTHDGFYELDRKRIRFIFAGEEALAKENPGRPITPEELHTWLTSHSEREDGLVEDFDKDTFVDRTGFASIESGLDLARYFWINRINDKKLWLQLFTEAAFKRFPEDTLQMAVRKLACGMAIIDQLAHEAANLGSPISANYSPPDKNEEFDRRLLSLRELWHQAHFVLVQLGRPDDELLQPLFDISELRQLAA